MLVAVTPDPAERIVQCMLLLVQELSVLHSRAFARGCCVCAVFSNVHMFFFEMNLFFVLLLTAQVLSHTPTHIRATSATTGKLHLLQRSHAIYIAHGSC